MAEYLFVYGTLRRGAPMHGLIEGRARPLGPASAPGRLLDLGHFPAFASAGAPGERVRGELYALDEAGAAELLEALDRYEGRSFVRERRTVQASQGPVEAWLYRWLGDPGGRRVVPGGDYLAAGSGTGPAE